jgi:hypothetical protein
MPEWERGVVALLVLFGVLWLGLYCVFQMADRYVIEAIDELSKEDDV